jgi:hypothetical protein
LLTPNFSVGVPQVWGECREGIPAQKTTSAKDYGSASDSKIAALLTDEELLEICHDD